MLNVLHLASHHRKNPDQIRCSKSSIDRILKGSGSILADLLLYQDQYKYRVRVSGAPGSKLSQGSFCAPTAKYLLTVPQSCSNEISTSNSCLILSYIELV